MTSGNAGFVGSLGCRDSVMTSGNAGFVGSRGCRDSVMTSGNAGFVGSRHPRECVGTMDDVTVPHKVRRCHASRINDDNACGEMLFIACRVEKLSFFGR